MDVSQAVHQPFARGVLGVRPVNQHAAFMSFLPKCIQTKRLRFATEWMTTSKLCSQSEVTESILRNKRGTCGTADQEDLYCLELLPALLYCLELLPALLYCHVVHIWFLTSDFQSNKECRHARLSSSHEDGYLTYVPACCLHIAQDSHKAVL
jgi:hypothetical protein